jgi:hypothetical protein|nr:MAG TPA: hypothetical protein [Caudoviricetes sp.]
MEERLKELKERLTSFIIDYNIKDFSVYINRTEKKYCNGKEEIKTNSVDIQLEV